MTTEKLPYGHLTMPERSTRRERTGGPLGSLVGVLGAAAVFASAVVLAVIVQNIGHEMGNLRAKVERDQEEMAKLQEKVAILTVTTESCKLRADRDQEEIAKLQVKAEKSDGEITKLLALAQRDHDDMAMVLSLRERIVVLETQIRVGGLPPNYAEQTSASPEGEQPGPVGETDSGVQNNNATMEGHKRSKRDAPNSVRIPLGLGCCQNQAGRDGRDGRDGVAGAPGLKGDPGQKGDIGSTGEPGEGAKGSKGETGLQGAKGQKGEHGTSANNGVGGAVYTRWGKKTCRSGTTTVYSGVAGGTDHNQPGGGTNYQCLPTNPQWGRYQDGVHHARAFMYGAEYQLDTNVPFGSTSLHDDDVPCAVCYVPTRGSKLMIPARNICPTGWTQEYDGYLMAGHYNHPAAKEYVCVDEQPEAVTGGHANQNGALFYPVEARCGPLPCPNYVEGRELTCVVCTK
ncbi:collagen alpha-4(IV) chain-like [Branchiostoma floridae]|uniref:Collagen alpha-4(IV) chain-like n=1 Tax=Branchiostoma floridae TaxID=7739 RepID=A0A9J7LQA6_BRAFL|nr:collagen alpha-4(IV) chain-like [Branchiostoma floridae]